jgi:hypothetical protein
MLQGGPVWLYLLLRLIEITLLILMTSFWLRSMHRAIEACHPVSRATDPGTVWLTFIPLFGFVWQFIAVSRAGETLAREYDRRGWTREENRPGLETGTIAATLVCLVFLLRIFFWIDIHPGLFFLCSIAIGFCMYRHLDRLNAYRERLDKEPDHSVAYSHIPFPNLQPQFPPYNQWPQNQPPGYPPFPPAQPQWNPSQVNYPDPYSQPYPPANSYPPPPNDQRWAPPQQSQQNGQQSSEENSSGIPDYDRWAPKKHPES